MYKAILNLYKFLWAYGYSMGSFGCYRCIGNMVISTDVSLLPPFPTGGFPLSFPLLGAVGVPQNIAVLASQPIEVTCNGTEDGVQQCRIARCSRPSVRTIAGVNCTGV